MALCCVPAGGYRLTLGNDHVTEAKLQQLVLDAIGREELRQHIADAAGLTSIPRDSDNRFPRFSVDHLSRLAAIRVGQSVLEALSFVELLTSDANISITSGEV